MPRHRPNPSKSPETLRAIETLLLWEGQVTNERVRQIFDLHLTSVSRLLAQYAELNGLGIEYNSVVRGYVASAGFKPLLTEGLIEEYLALERAQDGLGVIESTQLILGGVERSRFALLNRACREGKGLICQHRSMSHPAPRIKQLFPHALVQAGKRWHVRAFVIAEGDAKAGRFLDLAVNRLSSLKHLGDTRPEQANPDNDAAWQTQVEVSIVPHPLLTPEQKDVVRAEHFGGKAAYRLRTRAALLHYTLHELRCAIDPKKEPASEFHLCIEDPGKVKQWLFGKGPSEADSL